MLTIPHTLLGAAIGTLVEGNSAAPIIAFGLGWASHYALDAVPHWERVYKPHDDIDWGTDSPTSTWPRHIFTQAVLDVLIAVVIIVFIFIEKNPPNTAMLWGALGGAFPDLLGNVPYWNRFLVRFPLFKQEKQFHEWIHISHESQRSAHRLLGIITQLTVITIAIFIIFSA